MESEKINMSLDEIIKNNKKKGRSESNLNFYWLFKKYNLRDISFLEIKNWFIIFYILR